MSPRRTLALVATLALLVGCRGSSEGLGERCSPDALTTREKGRLTLSTGAVTRAPWVTGPREKGRSADPRNGKGYDAAVGFELARRLGFDTSRVTWVATPFADAVSPGAKPFDMNVNQVTIRDDRAKNVEFSRPYYAVRHAVVGLKGGRAAAADSVDELKGLRLAFRSGSTSERAVQEVFGDDVTAVGHRDDAELRRALTGGQADGIVTTFLTALRWDADETQLVDGELVGVLADAPLTDERFGIVLQKGSPLTACANQALQSMEDDGTLARLEQKWLVEENGWTWFA